MLKLGPNYGYSAEVVLPSCIKGRVYQLPQVSYQGTDPISQYLEVPMRDFQKTLVYTRLEEEAMRQTLRKSENPREAKASLQCCAYELFRALTAASKAQF